MTRSNYYRLFLFVCFTIVWVWAAWAPLYRDAWWLENYLVFIFVPVILLTARWFRISDLSYAFVTLFMIMHVIGSHYTYAEVPFGDTLKDLFGSSRNIYDRLVHFGYGLLLAYPFFEIFKRVAQVKGIWRYLFPIVLTFAMSAVYEIIEWLAARNIDPAAGLAFLGAQGDIWDGQKDMLLAGMGACITIGILFIWHAFCKEGFWSNLRESIHIEKDEDPNNQIQKGQNPPFAKP